MSASRKGIFFLILCLTVAHVVKAQCPPATLNPNFTLSTNFICGTPTSLTLANTSVGTVANATNPASYTSYEWFRDGSPIGSTTGLVAPPFDNISALGVGTYTYTLVANFVTTLTTATCTANTVSKTLIIRPTPTATYSFTNNNQCIGTTINFTNISTGTGAFTTYTWSMPAGSPNSSSSLNTSTVYTNPGGNRLVTLSVSNGAGCTSTSVQTVTVLGRPITSFTGNDSARDPADAGNPIGNTTYCLDGSDNNTINSVLFTNLTTGATSYTWDFGDGSGTLITTSTAVLTYDYSAYGTYPVKLIATSAAGCTSVSTLSVIFERTDISVVINDFPAGAAGGFCAPYTLALTNGSSYGNTYTWNFGDGTIITTTTTVAPTHLYTATGNYNITLTSSNNCVPPFTTNGPSLLKITAPATGNFTATPVIGCTSIAVTTTNLSTGTSASSNYYWDFGNGNIYSGVGAAFRTPNAANNPQVYTTGVYTLTSASSNGCGWGVLQRNIVVDTVPSGPIYFNPFTTNTCSSLTTHPTSVTIYPAGVFNYPVSPYTMAVNSVSQISTNPFTADCASAFSGGVNYPTTIVTYSFKNIIEGCGSFSLDVSHDVHGLKYTANGSTYYGKLNYDLRATRIRATDLTYTVNAPTTLTNSSAIGPFMQPYTYDLTPGIPVAGIITYTPTPITSYISPSHYIDTYYVNTLTTGMYITTYTPGYITTYVPIVSYVGSIPVTLTHSSGVPNVCSYPAYVSTYSVSSILVGATNVVTTTITTNNVNVCGAGSFNRVTGRNIIPNVNPLPTTTSSLTISPNLVATLSSLFVTTLTTSVPNNITSISSEPTVPTTVTIPSSFTAINFPDPGGNSPRDYFVNLKIWNMDVDNGISCGRRDSTIVVRVHPRVQAILTATSPTTICEGQTVNLSGIQSLGTPEAGNSKLTYSWNAGNGQMLSGTGLFAFTAIYPKAGNYITTLTVTGYCCTDVTTISITVKPTPIAPDPLALSVCAGNPITFTASGGGTYKWYATQITATASAFATGATTTVVTTASTSSYTVSRWVETAVNGCTSPRVEVIVPIKPLPVKPVVAPVTICFGTSAILSVTTLYPCETYQWYTTNTATTTATGTLTTTGDVFTTNILTATTSFFPRATSTDGCLSQLNLNAAAVTVTPLTTATVVNQTICGNSVASFTATAPASATFIWYDAPVAGSVLASLTNKYVTPTLLNTTTAVITYTYYVESTLNGCVGPLKPVYAFVRPMPIASFTPSTINGCSPLTVTFTNFSTTLSTYSWSFATGTPTTSTLYAPPNIVYNTTGIKTIILTVTLNNCIATQVTTLSVSPKPVSTFTLTPIVNCGSLITTFTNLSPFNAGDTYTWTFGNSNISNLYAPTDPETYTAVGVPQTYTVSLLIENSDLCTSISTKTVVVNPIPIASFTPSEIDICSNAVVSFTNNSSGHGALAYVWSFGDATATNSAINPSHLYSTPTLLLSTYSARLIVSTLANCKDTTETIITVKPNPIASFTAPAVCTGFVTSFSNLSSSDVLTWTYNFADGLPFGIVPDPVHSYSSNNNYITTLTVINSYTCTNVTTQSVLVNSTPIASFSNTTMCLGQVTTFTNISIGATTSWTWNFNDGTLATSYTQNPTHILSDLTLTDTGIRTYTVEFIAFAGAGCSDTISKVVSINPIPSTSFTFNSVCTKEDGTFNSVPYGLEIAADSYVWKFGDGTSNVLPNDPTPVHSYTVGTNYVVTLTSGYALSGCSNTYISSITIHPRTTPLFSYTTPCLTEATVFKDLTTYTAGNPVTTWSWLFGEAAAASSLQDPSHIYSVPTSYTVKLITQNSFACADSIQAVVNVKPLPTSSFTSSVECFGFGTQFTNHSVSTGSVVSWTYDFADALSASPQGFVASPIHTFTTATTYPVSLTVQNNFGCFDSYTDNVTVNPNPISSFSASVACHTYPTSFTNVSSVDVIGSTWQFGELGNTSTLYSPDYIYSNPSTYIATLTVVNTFTCTNVSTQSVLVNSTPIASFTNTTMCLGQVTTFTNVSTGATTSWTWNFNDGVLGTSSLQNPTHTLADLSLTDSGIRTYTVEFIAFAGAGCSDTITKIVNINPVPSTSFTFNSVCTKEDGAFNSVPYGLEIAADSYVWEFGDGTSNAILNDPDPVHSYTVGTNYVVTLTSGYGLTACTNTYISSITIHPRTTPLFTYTTPCLTEATMFTDLTTYTAGNPVTTWSWLFGELAASSNLQDPTFTYTSPTTFTVKLITQNSFACADSIELTTVNVRPLPVASFTSTTECMGFGTAFTNHSVSTGSVVSWTYDFADPLSLDPSQIIANPIHTFTTDNTYITTLTVQNSVGCFDTYTDAVVVNPNPVSSFSILPACYSYSSLFNDLSTSATTWTWDFGDALGSDVLASPIYTYTAPGTYTASLTVYNVFTCSNVSTQTAIVLEQPNANFKFDVLCAGDIVTFTDVTVASNLTSWTWTFGDATGFNNLQNPQHMYALGGNYPVKFVVENIFGCKDTIIKSLQAYTVPHPHFSASTVCNGLSTGFTDSSTDLVPITTWSWDFDDGNNSASQNPNYIYSNHGVYTVGLTVTNTNGCDSSIVNLVTVNESTIASYTTDIVCVGVPTSFTDVSLGSPTSWTWSFGDGFTDDSGASTTHTYATAGTYFTSLIAVNGGGCSDDIFKAVVVKNAIIPGITLKADACLNESVLLKDNSTYTPGDMAQSDWSFGDGNAVPNTLNTNYAYPTVGSYVVTHTVTSIGGCSSFITENIEIHHLPVADFNFAGSCETQLTSFTDASTIAADAITSWTWDFANGNFSNTQNPTQTYAAQNTYLVQLDVTSDFGCKNSITKGVVINPNTIPAFTANDACLNQNTIFADVTVGNPVSWTWSFGDASAIDNNQNPTHIYATPTTYTVKLLTENIFGCKDSTTAISKVNPLPVASYSSTIVCDDIATTFNNLSVGATSYTWSFGDGSAINNLSNPVYLFATDGTYITSLTAHTMFGCSTQFADNVIVRPNPFSSFTATTACQGYVNNFTDASTGAVTSWTWSFGDGSGTSILPTTTYIYPIEGNYITSLTVKNVFGCANTSAQSVTVLEQPQSNFSYSLPCNNQTVNFTNLSSGNNITSWTYAFGDLSASTLQNPTHSYLGIGTYTVQFIAHNTVGCKDTTEKTLRVYSVPNPSFTASTACRGTITDFTDYTTDIVPITDWFWDYDDGNNSIASNPDYIYGNDGVYTVELTATNINGCSASTSNLVTVNAAVIASYTANEVCIGLPTYFSDISVGSPTSWTWAFGDGNTATGGPITTHSYVNPGQYISSVLATSNAGCSDDAFVVITVRNDITPGIIAPADACLNENVTILDNSTYTIGTTYSSGSWSFGDSPVMATSLNTTHTYSVVGTYVISHTVVSDFGCVSGTSQNIKIHNLPVVDFSFDTSCQNQTVAFTNNSTLIDDIIQQWDWNFGNANNSNLQNPSTVYLAGNTYPVSLTATSDFGCESNTIKNILIHSKPNASFVSDLKCWGSPTNLTNTSTSIDGAIVSQIWNLNNEKTTNELSPTYTFTTKKDSFNVQLNIETIFGCLDSIKKRVYTYPLPAFKYGPVSQSGCDDYTATFKDSSTVRDGSIVNWFWNFGDNNYSYQKEPVHTYKTPGEYTVSVNLTSSHGCTVSDTLNYPLVVFESPVAAFNANPNELSESLPEINIIDKSDGARYWEYDFGDLETSILHEPTHTYADTGFYTIRQIVYNEVGCMDSTFRTIKVNGVLTVFIPNAFTPEGNNLNDIFILKGKGIKAVNMIILNRWGDVIFTSDDMTIGWNGNIHNTGDPAKQDVYVYKATVTDELNNQYFYSGNVTLIR